MSTPDSQSEPRLSDGAVITVFECPECGHWYGEREGLWSKPHHCPGCIRAKKASRPKHRQNITLGSDVTSAPMTVPVEVSRAS